MVSAWLLDIVIGAIVLMMAFIGAVWFYQHHVQPTRAWDIGDLVQVRFKGCPDVILRAAGYDKSGSTTQYDPVWSSVTTRFCELPLIEDLSGNSSWLVDAGWGYRSTQSGGGDEFCGSVTASWGTENMTCSNNSDCYNVLACNLSQNGQACDPTVCDPFCKPGDTQNPDCPCGISCGSNTSGRKLPPGKDGVCLLDVTPTFTCREGQCKLMENPLCPPPATCTVLGMMGQASTNSSEINLCSLGAPRSISKLPDGTEVSGYDPHHPCTGCQIGQTCQPYDATTGWGTCTGVARQLVPIKVDFIAEGVVYSITSQGDAWVQWNRIQCDAPYALQPDGIPENLGPKELGGKTRDQWREEAKCPLYHRGCIAWKDHTTYEMQKNLFGDAANQVEPTYRDLTPLYGELEFEKAPLWPLQALITDGGKTKGKVMGNGTFSVVPISTYTIIEHGASITDPNTQNQTCESP